MDRQTYEEVVKTESSLKEAITKAHELGATSHQRLINWFWSYGFTTEITVGEFQKWLLRNGYDFRPPRLGDNGTWEIRYRR